MMLDDRDLASRFRARAAQLPDPSPALFSVTMARVDALPQRSPRLVRSWKEFTGLRFAFAGGLAAALTFACVIGLVQLAPHNAFAPRVEEVRMDVSPARGAAESVIAPAPKMIKINTLKTNPSVRGGIAPEPPVASVADSDAAAIARAETLALLVRDVPFAIASLNAIARTNGGIVTTVDDSAPDDPNAPRTATLTLAVSAPKLDSATTRILALGAVQSRRATAEAIGDSIVDDRARLRNLRREERDLLHIMDRSGSVASILDVESKLADVRGQIEQLDAHLAGSNHRVATSQIDVTLTESRPTRAVASPSTGDHISATWNAALRSIAAFGIAVVDFGLWTAAYAPLWIVPAIAAGVLIFRWRSRF
jgi:Domain of unknown function (DUF4349)